MILNPAVLALLGASGLIAATLVYAAFWGLRILRGWDLASGSRAQLELERRTVLVSTLVRYVLGFELLSLVLYVHTADRLAPLLPGAMCAAGTLHAAPWGYHVLVLKLVTAVAAGVWLVLDRADRHGPDYPLIRPKYLLLVGLAPLIVAGSVMMARYFTTLRPEVITSCCGSLFAEAATPGRGATAGAGIALASLPPRTTGIVLWATLGAAVLAGAIFRLRPTRRRGYVFATLAGLLLPLGIAAIIAFVSPYIYALPTHHCPFCLLQREYSFIGYPMYAALLAATVCGVGVGALGPFRRTRSIASAVRSLQRRLGVAAMALLVIFAALVLWSVTASELRM